MSVLVKLDLKKTKKTKTVVANVHITVIIMILSPQFRIIQCCGTVTIIVIMEFRTNTSLTSMNLCCSRQDISYLIHLRYLERQNPNNQVRMRG